MTTDRARQISELLELTHLSLENAMNGEWETVVQLEMRRRNMITELFAQQLNAEEAAQYISSIENILQLNKQLEQLTTEARNCALLDAGSIRNGRQALNLYAQNTG